MKSAIKISLAVSTLLLFVMLSHLTADAQAITFVQFSDAHLFDSAKHGTTQAGFEDYLDNRSSLEWAIKVTNDFVRSGKPVNFVVFTGDFGLEDSDPSDAARQVATIFRALLTKRVFLLPGNNDLHNENPQDIGRFREFREQLAILLPDYQIEDLTSTTQTVNGIQLVGLNSATFKNNDGKLQKVNKQDQLKEMQRVEAALRPNQPSVIFTHIPNLEDPHRGDKGEVHTAWNVSREILDLWKKIIVRDDVLAVFAGHFHDSRRGVYMHDFSWASQKPPAIEAMKTWIAPPLAIKFQWGIKPQARGLIEASVASDGTVHAIPIWFGYSSNDIVPDKDALLVQAEAEANHGHWEQSLAFYTKAISSNDPDIHARAESGYLIAHENLLAAHAFQRTIWVILIVIALFTALLFVRQRAALNRREGKFVIEPPSKSGADVPAEFFMAALVSSAREIQALYRLEQERGNLSLVDTGRKFSFSVLSDAGKAFGEIADALPEIRGVKVGKIVGAIPMVLRFLIKWRIEYGLAVHEDGTGWAHATLRWRWTTEATWVESLKVKADENSQESLQSTVVRMLAWRIASDILSKDLVEEMA